MYSILSEHFFPKEHLSFALSCSAIIYHCDLSELNPEPKVFREVEVKGVKQEDFQTNQVMLYLPRFFNTALVFSEFLESLLPRERLF